MNAKFINSINSKTSDPRRHLLNLTDKIDLRRKDKYITLSNLSVYCTCKNIKESYKNNKFKVSAPVQFSSIPTIWITLWIMFYIKYSRLFRIKF